MNENQDIMLISPCGIYCADCACFRVKDNPDLLAPLIANGISEDQLPCPGCRALDGNCLHLDSQCENFICATDHKVDFCYECVDFPCTKLHPALDRANVLPHNMKMYSQCYIMRHGIQAWIEKLPEIKKRYFTGKISYGKGPILPEEMN